MIVDYSAQDGLVAGAAKTFDGAHPCCMCKAIAEGKKQESKDSKEGKVPQMVQSLLLKECLPAKVAEAPRPASCDAVLVPLPELDLLGAWIGYRPPVPPPRFVA